jgi:hypothetical protein
MITAMAVAAIAIAEWHGAHGDTTNALPIMGITVDATSARLDWAEPAVQPVSGNTVEYKLFSSTNLQTWTEVTNDMTKSFGVFNLAVNGDDAKFFRLVEVETPPPFIPVTHIATNFASVMDTGTTLALGGTVYPIDASNQSITWSVSGLAGASVSGSTLTAPTIRFGDMTVTATISNGVAVGTHYVTNFIVLWDGIWEWNDVDHTIKIDLAGADFGKVTKLPANFDVAAQGNNGKTNAIYMRYINAGKYVSGSPSDEANPVARVQKVLTNGFYIGAYAMTVAQYNLAMNNGVTTVANATNSRPQASIAWNTIRTGSATTEILPLEDPSAASVLGKLTTAVRGRADNLALKASHGVDLSKIQFNLPTEGQWEFACRANVKGSFGNTNAFLNPSTNFDAAWTNTINEVA